MSSELKIGEVAIRRFVLLKMALVPVGCFQLASTPQQLLAAVNACDQYFGAFGCQQNFTLEMPPHEVCFEEPYWIGLTPVTNGQSSVQ